MSITEQTLARLRSAESYWGVTRPAALFAMLSLLSGDISAPPTVHIPEPYYTAVEASSSSFPACLISRWSDIEKPRYRPRTALGKRLIAIREQAIAKGLRLMNVGEIIEEIRRRRGEID